jgi:hypothetical protein
MVFVPASGRPDAKVIDRDLPVLIDVLVMQETHNHLLHIDADDTETFMIGAGLLGAGAGEQTEG